MQVIYAHWMLSTDYLLLLSDLIKCWPSNLSRSACIRCIPLEDERKKTKKKLMTSLLAIDYQCKSIHVRTWSVAFSRVNYSITTSKNDKLSIRSINEKYRLEFIDASKHKYSHWCHCFLFLVFGLACRKVIDCKIAYIAVAYSKLEMVYLKTIFAKQTIWLGVLSFYIR